MNSASTARIFVSYSHRGDGPEWKAALLRALDVFERHHLLDVWQDGRIRVSAFWDDDIKRAMVEARLVVLLLTKEALESEYIVESEFPVLRDRQRHEKLPVFPVICEECDWRAHDWLRATQAPNNSSPLSLLCKVAQDRVFRKLATDIARELSRSARAEMVTPSPLTVEGGGVEGEGVGDVRTYLESFPNTHTTSAYEEDLVGREQELALLDLAWTQPHTRIVSLVAWGGVGKTVLVQHWLQRLQRDGWFGTHRVYAWSFYSQGTTEDRQASEDSFLAHALEWFGVQCAPTLPPWDKGRLLADAVLRERTLLILDGIEPLQYPPGPMGGQLRAPGVQALLKQLARKAGDSEHSCLGLVTTRESLTDLAAFQRRPDAAWGSVLHVDLGNLNDEAGAALLHHAGGKRVGTARIDADDAELLAASREVDGHALTLSLLGRFIARAHNGDIRRRDLVKFEEADREEQGGTAFKMLAAFEKWFENEGEIEARALAILRLLGLFERPADAACMAALRRPPLVTGLTEPLFAPKPDVSGDHGTLHPLSDAAWKAAISFLVDFRLVVFQVDDENRESRLDCHPLVREHFAESVRDRRPESWRAAHLRLYLHLKHATSDKQRPTLADLQPLYHAVAHGCQAGMYEEARVEVFGDRILRFRPGLGPYSSDQLGAFGADLSATACFFLHPWSQVSSNVPESERGWVLTQAGVCLRALGRLEEALEPLQAALRHAVHRRDWRIAAIGASHASELELLLGFVVRAVDAGRQSVGFADRCGDEFQRTSARVMLADALHCAGDRDSATTCFGEAEEIQAKRSAEYRLLSSRLGFRYCDLLLHSPERASWQIVLQGVRREEAQGERVVSRPLRLPFWRRSGDASAASVEGQNEPSESSDNPTEAIRRCREVAARAAETLEWGVEARVSRYTVALDQLTLGRALLYRAILSRADLRDARSEIGKALDGLLRAGERSLAPRGLLTRAWLRVLDDDADGARADLDEAWDVAERGPMRLHLVDIHLHRARLFLRVEPYPWNSPPADLAAARQLIEQIGYWRRTEELNDAERIVLGVG